MGREPGEEIDGHLLTRWGGGETLALVEEEAVPREEELVPTSVVERRLGGDADEELHEPLSGLARHDLGVVVLTVKKQRDKRLLVRHVGEFRLAALDGGPVRFAQRPTLAEPRENGREARLEGVEDTGVDLWRMC
jgi:hypothetical protein